MQGCRDGWPARAADQHSHGATNEGQGWTGGGACKECSLPGAKRRTEQMRPTRSCIVVRPGVKHQYLEALGNPWPLRALVVTTCIWVASAV